MIIQRTLMIFLKLMPSSLLLDIIGDKKIRIQVYLTLIFKFQSISPKNTKKNLVNYYQFQNTF
jgi:hypothetical protein